MLTISVGLVKLEASDTLIFCKLYFIILHLAYIVISVEVKDERSCVDAANIQHGYYTKM